MQIATLHGGARCPLCRRVFETVTHQDGRFVVDVEKRTLYHCGSKNTGSNNTLIPYIVMSDTEIKIASRMLVREGRDESGQMGMHFYVPQFLQDMTTLVGWNLVVTNVDDVRMERVMTRSDSRLYSYDQDKCRQVLAYADIALKKLLTNHQIPLFFMKAVVSKAFMRMITHRKYDMNMYRSHPEDETGGGEHILSMVYPVSFTEKLAAAGVSA
jgi:hypothetical protein